MQAQEYLKEGNVNAALDSLMQAVRDEPQNSENRTFLFQLLSVTGQWDRALNQLVVAGEMDSQALPMVQTYRETLSCEALRAQVFAGKRSPLIFGDPEEWIAWILESLKLLSQGNIAEAAKLRERAFEAAPAISGSIDGNEFEWLADADSRIGPFFEAVVNGNYYWIPMHRVSKVEFEAPVDLRDLVWTPAYFSWTNGGQAVGLVPARYPGSEASDDGMIQLGRRTEWSDLGENTFCGLGQRLFATDATDYAQFDVREINLDVEPDSDSET